MKRSLLVEADGGPLAVVIAGANVPDFKLLEATLDAIVVERPQSTEEAPQHLCSDKGYDNQPATRPQPGAITASPARTFTGRIGPKMRAATLLTGAFMIALTVATTAAAQEEVDQPAPSDAPASTLDDLPSTLFVRVLDPSDEAIEVPSSTASIAVRGLTLADAVASVDGILVPVDAQGLFVSIVPLDLGVNDIDVVASTADGAQADTTLIVIRADD